MSGLEKLAEMEYPGRVIIIGKMHGTSNIFVAYAITGRSESSRARKFEVIRVVGDSWNVRTAPTNPEALKKGNPKLLIYNAVIDLKGHVVVSNGAQTDLIADVIKDPPSNVGYKTYQGDTGLVGEECPVDFLVHSFICPRFFEGIDLTSYEPDAPNFTPRISGVLTKDGNFSLAICKHAHSYNETVRQYFQYPRLSIVPGQAKMISTYTGVNQDPLPSFVGEPVDLYLDGVTTTEIAKEIYSALGPRGDKDFRVGVAVMSPKEKIAIINRCEEAGK